MQWSLGTSRFSLSSLKLYVNGITVIGCTLAEPTEKLEGEIMYGNGPLGLGKVIGKLSGSVKLGFIPEEHDKLLAAVGNGFYEFPMAYSASLYEPANPAGVYTIENDSIWLEENGLAIAREGAVITSSFVTGTDPTRWNGMTGLDLASRATDPGSIGAIFAAFGLSI